MPVVPKYESQAEPRVGGLPQLNTRASGFGSQIADSVGRLGGALNQASDALAQHALKMQDQDNHALADDAISNFMLQQNELLYNPEHGYYNSSGKDALDQFTPARDSLMKLREDTAGALPNEQARDLFDSATRSQVQFNIGNMGSHAAAGRKEWITKSADAVINQVTNTAILNYNSDAATDEAMNTVREKVAAKADAMGLDDPAIVNQLIVEQAGKVWSGRIQQMAINDPVAAQAMYDKNRDMLPPETQIALGRQLQAQVLPQEARAIVEQLKVGQAPAEAGKVIGPFANAEDARTQITALVPGTIFTSGQRTPEHNAAVGGVANSNHLDGRAWDMVPPRGMTMAQLADKMKGSGLGFSKVLNEGDHVHVQWNAGAAPGLPTGRSIDITAHSTEFIQAARDAAVAARPTNFQFQDQVENLARQEVSQRAAEQRAQEIESMDRLATVVAGGPTDSGPKATNLSQITSNPQLARDWAALPASSQRTITNMMKANANEVTPQRQENYLNLLGYSLRNPAGFKDVDLAKYDLTPENFKSLSASQVRAISHAAPNPQIGHMLAMPEVRGMLQSAGVKQPGQPGFQPKDTHFNGFVGSMSEVMNTFQEVHGRPPNDNEIKQLTAQQLQKSGGFLGMGGEYAFDRKVPLVPGVPNTEVGGIADVLRRQSGREPTSAEIRQAYEAP